AARPGPARLAAPAGPRGRARARQAEAIARQAPARRRPDHPLPTPPHTASAARLALGRRTPRRLRSPARARSTRLTRQRNRQPTRNVAHPAASSCPPKTQTRRTRHRPLTTTPTSNAEQTKPPLPRPAPLTIPRDDRLREESRLSGVPPTVERVEWPPRRPASRGDYDLAMPRYLHTMYRITDPDRSRVFYEALGFEFSHDMDIVRDGQKEATNYFFAMPGQEEELELTFNHDGRTYDLGTGYGHIALAIDDMDATLSELASHGIEPERPPYQVREGGSFLCFVRDPDGYRIELIEKS